MNSWHFRGVRAAWDVMGTHADSEGNFKLLGAEEIRPYMNLGLTAIQEVGNRPLAEDFVAAYNGWTEVIFREATAQ